MYFEQDIMYSSLFDSFFTDSFFAPHRTVYVVSDSQLTELKQRQNKEELKNIAESRQRLEATYQSRIKILDEREEELKKELKVISPTKKGLVKA